AVTGYVVHLVAERHRGRALSFVLGGWMTATALGVPVGLILGQSSWRLPLLLVSTVGFVALLGIGLRLPPLRYPSSSLADRLRPHGGEPAERSPRGPFLPGPRAHRGPGRPARELAVRSVRVRSRGSGGARGSQPGLVPPGRHRQRRARGPAAVASGRDGSGLR